MSGVKNISIRNKLIIIQSATAFVALLIACTFFVVNDIKTFKATSVTNKHSIAEIVGENSASPLLFQDQDAANKILSNFSSDGSILNAAILDKKGNEFARYSKIGEEAFSFPAPEESERIMNTFFEKKYFVSAKIFQNKEFVGTVLLRAELTALNTIISNHIKVAILILIGGVLAALVISIFLQRVITKRLLSLVAKTKEVAVTGNYAIRAQIKGNDEIVVLAEGFNTMLNQIEKTKKELDEANTGLEEQVQQRTGELKEYQHFFNNSNDLSCIANTEGYFEIVNPSFEKVLGYSGNELSENPFLNFVHPDDIPATLQIYEELKAGAPVVNFTNRYRKKDGSYRWFDWNATPNPITGKLYCIARDITERKKAEEQLLAVNKELEAFSYSVSHDLRAPLRAVGGYAKMLQEDYNEKLDADGVSSLNAIMHNSKKMGALIDDLLAFSRLGRKSVTTSEINMTALIKSVREEETTGNSNEIDFTIHELLPAKGDQALIKQVWVNLISNAIKYSKHKPKTIIEIGSSLKDNLVEYYVKDNGAGFDMQYYDKLFGVFQRLHSEQEFEGTGIGLAIVQKIINRHHGTVWAESTLNEGSTFYFTLPTINS